MTIGVLFEISDPTSQEGRGTRIVRAGNSVYWGDIYETDPQIFGEEFPETDVTYALIRHLLWQVEVWRPGPKPELLWVYYTCWDTVPNPIIYHVQDDWLFPDKFGSNPRGMEEEMELEFICWNQDSRLPGSLIRWNRGFQIFSVNYDASRPHLLHRQFVSPEISTLTPWGITEVYKLVRLNGSVERASRETWVHAPRIESEIPLHSQFTWRTRGNG